MRARRAGPAGDRPTRPRGDRWYRAWVTFSQPPARVLPTTRHEPRALPLRDRKGNPRDNEIRRRQAPDQARLDPVVVAPLTNRPHRSTAGRCASGRRPGAGDDRGGLRRRRRSLREVLVVHRDRLKQPPTLWVAYPKGNKADINRDTLWPIMGDFGMRPITQVAIDQVWSGLRFRALREGEAPFTEGDRRHDRPTTASRRSQAVDLGDPESLSGVRVRSRGDHS